MMPYECRNCSRVTIQTKSIDLCEQCKRNAFKFTASNKINLGIVPNGLKDLTYVEQLLIAKVQPVMRVYRIKSRGFPGQYSYKGNIINIGQNITEIARNLPQATTSLRLVIVRRENSSGHRNFYVRRVKILKALNFLKNNNPFLTLSAADLWWPDLARLMNWNFDEEELLNES